MKVVGALIKRNVKCYFKDKAMFITSLITPIILLTLYAVFLYDVYKDSFTMSIPQDLVYDEKLLDGLVGGLLLSSLLAVSTITVSFCANLYMVQDKATKARNDFVIAPVKPYKLAFGYFLATALNGLIISLVATVLGCAYLSFKGWYLSVADVALLLLDVLLLVLLGTSLSSLICYPLTTQGQLSAVGTVISAGYGFICGAYMPLSQYGTGLRNVLTCLPGTYGTSLLRNHALQGVLEEMSAQNFPAEAIEAMKATADCSLEFFGHNVEIWQMYLVLVGAILLFTGLYVLLNYLDAKRLTKAKKVK
ncbi:MAG: ABC transporter permease [Clostridia bacterium]|nr:ABC transporter permease [Clostridia bacterium]